MTTGQQPISDPAAERPRSVAGGQARLGERDHRSGLEESQPPRQGRRWFSQLQQCGLFLLLTTTLAACQSDEKVVRYKPFFTGLAGAEYGGGKPDGLRPVNPSQGYQDPTGGKQSAEEAAAAADQKLITKAPDGKKTVHARNVRGMTVALELLLDSGDDDVIMRQLVSEKTIEEYRARGEDPKQILRFMRFYRKDLAKLFARMPMGEHTPTVVLDQPGDKMWVLRLTGVAAKDMEFTKLWTRLEDGNWRFVWVE